jgi:hypothetical protein
MTTPAGRGASTLGIEVPDGSISPLGNSNVLSLFFVLLGSDLLGEFVSVHGMLVRLLAEFVSRQVIFFAMGDRRG